MRPIHEVFYANDFIDTTDLILFKQFVENYAKKNPHYTYAFIKDTKGIYSEAAEQEGPHLWEKYCGLSVMEYKQLAEQAGYILDDNLELVG